MLFRTNKPGIDFIYPCSKSHVKKIFGNDLLGWASFVHEYSFDRRCKYPIMSGIVIAAASVDTTFGINLSLYRTIKGFYCPGQRDHFLRLLESEVRTWVESKRARLETETARHQELLIEFVGGGFKLHSVSLINHC